MAEDDDLIPDSGAVFTFGRSRFADNYANKFWIKNDPVLHVACGDEHSAVLTERGRVYVFGSNEWGQLGIGHVKPSNKPSFVKALKPEKIILLACGRSHTLVYSESGKLFSFGANGDGQLGHGDKQNENSPKEITTLSAVSLKRISCGAYHSAALTENGEVYVWGVNSDGQLGLGETEEFSVPTKLAFEHVTSLCCGYYHTALITKNGLLYTFGEDENGKLGLTDSQLNNTTHPQSIAKLAEDKYTEVSCGARHTVAITKKGCCYSWGDGSQGQLGHGTMLLEVALPKQIDLLSHLKIIYLSCGDSHTAVVTDSGKIYTFGDGRHGKLGQGDECFSNLFKPTVITRFNGFHVNFVACGGCHMLVGAIQANAENTDEVDSEVVAEQEDTLNASMRSNQSIAEANMTLKPGSMTYPLVTPRDKRRRKEDDVLNNSLNLNSSLNSSANMAQLSRTIAQLPTVLDRSRLPKIPGVNQISINNYDGKYLQKIKEDTVADNIPKSSGNIETQKNSKLVAAISFSRENNNTQNKTNNKQSNEVGKNKLPLDRRKGSDESVELNNNTNYEAKIETECLVESTGGKTSPEIKQLYDDSSTSKEKKQGKKDKKKVDDKRLEKIKTEKDEIEGGSDEGKEKMQSKKDKKKVGDKIPGKIEMGGKENEDEAGKEKKQIKKDKKKMNDKETSPSSSPSKKKMEKNKKEESEEDEEEEEDEGEGEEEEEEEEEVTSAKNKKLKSALKSKDIKEDMKKKKKGTPVKENKMKNAPQKKFKKIEDSEDEDEDEEDEDEDEDDDEEDDKEEEIEDIEDEEDSEDEEESSPEIKKKGKKASVLKGKNDKESPKGKMLNKKGDKVNKQINVKESKEVEKSPGKKRLQKKTPEKIILQKKGKTVKKDEEEDEEEDDDDEDDEDDETDEDDEDEDEDEQVVDDKEENDDGDGDKTDGKKSKRKEKLGDANKESNVEESKSEANSSGFLNFFRRNKKPQVAVAPPDSKSPERTQSPGERTNKNQSKTCTVL